MSQHTPGPWKTLPYPEYDSNGDDVAEPEFVAAVVSEDGEQVCGTCDGCNKIKKDDAHLIAAAPVLLEALEYAEEYLEGCVLVGNIHPTHSMLVAVKAALGKARSGK